MILTDRTLRQVLPLTQIQPTLKNDRMIRSMIKTMHRQNGIGLSANQVGQTQRVFVMRYSRQDLVCWNPKIQWHSDDMFSMVEGCLSFPGAVCEITRPNRVKVLYYDGAGILRQHFMSGIESRCFQHELDHLNGITMWQRYKEQHAEQC